MRYLLLCLVLGSGLAQEPQTVQEEIRVVYREMRVHVVDEDDQPVRGLTEKDFALTLNGDPVEIQFFEEISYDNPATGGQTITLNDSGDDKAKQAPDRFILLFIDTAQVPKRLVEGIRNSVMQLVRRQAGPNTYFKLVHMDSGYARLSPGYTRDPNKIEAALGNMKYMGTLLNGSAIAELRLINAQDTALLAFAAGQDGSAGNAFENLLSDLPAAAGRNIGMFRSYHLATFRNALTFEASALEDVEGNKSIFLFTGGQFALPSFAGRIGELLNAGGITMYTMMADNPRPIPFARRSTHYDHHMLTVHSRATAEKTGGFFAKGSTGGRIEQKLELLEKQAAHYYRFVFPMIGGTDQAETELTLNQPREKVRLIYGKSLRERAPVHRRNAFERHAALDTLLRYGGTWQNDLDVLWDYQLFKREKSGYLVPLLMSFPYFATTKGVEIAFLAMDEEREVLDKVVMTLPNLPEDKHLRFYDLLSIQTVPRYLRYYLRDLDTGKYSFHEIEIPQNEPAKIMEAGISRVAVNTTNQDYICRRLHQFRHIRFEANLKRVNAQWAAAPENAKDQLYRRKQRLESLVAETQARLQEDPYAIGDNVFLPSPVKDLPSGDVQFFFHMDQSPEEAPSIQILVTSGKNTIPVAARLSKPWREGSRQVRYMGVADTASLEPGDYRLWVRVLEENREARITGTAFSLKQ